MEKVCSKCDTSKPLSEFNKRKDSKDGYAYECKACKKEYRQSWYAANRDDHLRATTKRHLRVTEENKMRYCAYLEEHECADCGETNILVLEPDHVRGEKKYNVSELILRAYAWKTIEAELAKCEIVCRNCHADREARRQNNYKVRYLVKKYLVAA